MKRALPFVIIFAILLAALVTARYLRQTARTPNPSTGSRSQPQIPSGPARLGADPPHTLGNPDAPVMLEEFADFECPACASAHASLKQMKSTFGPRIVIVYRQYPMANLHPHAELAARASEAAGLQGKFWEMHDLLFENQSTWHEVKNAAPIFEQYAERIGLDLSRYRQDLNGQTVQQRIALDRERAQWIGVNGTPTVFLNGREVPADSITTDKLRNLINQELSKTR